MSKGLKNGAFFENALVAMETQNSSGSNSEIKGLGQFYHCAKFERCK
jgi:hypothetical protein